MKIINERTLIADVAQRWAAQYPLEKKGIGEALRRLDPETSLAEDVAKIIGHDGWTSVPQCSECARTIELVVELGELPDFDSHTVWLCSDCIAKAFHLVGGQK